MAIKSLIHFLSQQLYKGFALVLLGDFCADS